MAHFNKHIMPKRSAHSENRARDADEFELSENRAFEKLNRVKKSKAKGNDFTKKPKNEFLN